MSLSREHRASHEALHATMTYVLEGPRLDAVSIRGHSGGLTTWNFDEGYLLKAADLVLQLLAPWFCGLTEGCDSDLDKAWKVAKLAYERDYAAQRTDDPDVWIVTWIHGSLRTRAEEILDSARFQKLHAALKAALLKHEILSGPEVLMILREAEADPEPEPEAAPVRSDAELRRALEGLSAP